MPLKFIPAKSSPPGLPSVDKVTKNSVDLSWTKPRSDGGSPIRGYQVEKRHPGGAWEKVIIFHYSLILVIL